MFDDLLRRLKDRWFAPLAWAIGDRVSPMVVTVTAFVAGVACAVAIVQHANSLAVVLWTANRALDGLDGTLARMQRTQSALGGYVDIVLDFVIYAILPLAMIASAADVRTAMNGAFMLAAFLVNAASWMYLAAILERRNLGVTVTGELTTVTMPPGIVAGAETFVFYLVFIAIPDWRMQGFAIMGGLVLLNVVQRLKWASRHLR